MKIVPRTFESTQCVCEYAAVHAQLVRAPRRRRGGGGGCVRACVRWRDRRHRSRTVHVRRNDADVRKGLASLLREDDEVRYYTKPEREWSGGGEVQKAGYCLSLIACVPTAWPIRCRRS